ncbi:TetR family transcriptional regulator, partial [Acinetobacter baumannii]
MSATTQVQHRIHAAAMRLFAQQSGRQPSVSELAAAAGVTRGTIYNHITSTSQLFEQLVS